jgi:hypothetical protein
MLIASAQPEAPRSAQAHGVFYRQTMLVNLPGGAIRLASSPDGQGALCTDDQATLSFTAGGQVVRRWSHRFSADNRRTIACLPPQRLDPPLATGAYEITIELEDLDPDTYGSTAYYLIVATTAPTPQAASEAPEITRAVSPTRLPDRAQTSPPATTQPLATPTQPRPSTVQDISSFSEGTVAPASGVSAPPSTAPRWSLLGPALAAGALTFVLLALALMRARRRTDAELAQMLSGVLYLFDRETREARTVIFSENARAIEVRRQPLAVVALPSQEQRGIAIAQLLSTPEGPALRDLAGADDTLLTLQHDSAHVIAGVVELRYRAQDAFRAPLDGARRHDDDEAAQFDLAVPARFAEAHWAGTWQYKQHTRRRRWTQSGV